MFQLDGLLFNFVSVGNEPLVAWLLDRRGLGLLLSFLLSSEQVPLLDLLQDSFAIQLFLHFFLDDLDVALCVLLYPGGRRERGPQFRRFVVEIRACVGLLRLLVLCFLLLQRG